jgi:hypothetical protein
MIAEAMDVGAGLQQRVPMRSTTWSTLVLQADPSSRQVLPIESSLHSVHPPRQEASDSDPRSIQVRSPRLEAPRCWAVRVIVSRPGWLLGEPRRRLINCDRRLAVDAPMALVADLTGQPHPSLSAVRHEDADGIFKVGPLEGQRRAALPRNFRAQHGHDRSPPGVWVLFVSFDVPLVWLFPC